MTGAELAVVPGAECAGLGEVAATWRDAATGAEDEHAARASPATPAVSMTLIARHPAGRRPRNLTETCCLAMSTLVLSTYAVAGYPQERSAQSSIRS